MAAISNQSSWRDSAIAKSEIITDAWEVTKSYTGRLAEWILFLCMIFCIIEILPGVTFPTWASNVVLGVQAVMLDIGGFGLSSMADHARTNGDERAARKADKTGKFLIGIVILTLALITVGLLYPPAKEYTDGAEKVLILVRVVMTVVYGHVIHSLRRQSATLAIQPVQGVQIEQIDELKAQIAELASSVSQVHLSIATLAQPVQTDRQSVQMYTTICTHVQALKIKIDSVHVPVQMLSLFNQTIEDCEQATDETVIEEQISSDDTQVDESTPQEDAPLVYPFVAGISEAVVKQIIDLHLSGVAWSAVGTQLSKNYSRIVKPVKEAYTQANSDMDTDRHPVHINLYRQAVL